MALLLFVLFLFPSNAPCQVPPGSGATPPGGSEEIEPISNQIPPDVSEEELTESLEALKEFADVEISEKADDGRAVRTLAQTRISDLPDLEIAYHSTLAAKALLSGHNKGVRDLALRVIRRLQIDSDPTDWTIQFNASPIPNASIQPETKVVTINAGLLAFAKDEDEFASVIAHEMTHGNPEIFARSADQQEVNDILAKLNGYRGLQPRQIEELRADLGALHRLIKGGYNPWAQYEFERRFAVYFDGRTSHRWIRRIWNTFAPRSLAFLADHPVSEIRMAATKLFILQRGYRQDLSELTATKTKFPLGINLLRARLKAFSAPVISPWPEHAFKAYLGYFAISSVGLTDLATWKSAAGGVTGTVKEGLDWFGRNTRWIEKYVSWV